MEYYKNKSRLDDFKDEIADLYKQNYSAPEICKLLNLNVSERQVQRYVKKLGINRSVREALKLCEKRRVETIKRKWESYRSKKKKIVKQGIYPSLRYKILSRDKFKCVLCGWGQEEGVRLEVDHIIPQHQGGKNNIDNLRTLCQLCNVGRNGNDYKAPFDLTDLEIELLNSKL